MEIKKMLEELLENFTLELNEVISKLSCDKYPLQEIKDEDLMVIKDDDIEFAGDDDFVQSPLHFNGESPIYFANDSELPDSKKENSQVVNANTTRRARKSALIPRKYLSDDEDQSSNYFASDSPSLNEKQNSTTKVLRKRKSRETNENPLKVVRCSNLGLGNKKEWAPNRFPVVVLQRLKMDNAGKIIVQNEIPSIFCQLNKIRSIRSGLRSNSTSNSTSNSISNSTSNSTSNSISNSTSNSRNVKERNRKGKNKEKLDGECKICGKPDPANMKLHLLSHNGEDEKPLKCPCCGKGYNYRKKLNAHLAMQHLHVEAGENVCSVCGKQFRTRTYLLLHMGRHNGKDFSCSLCKASFKSRETLIRHENIHKGKTYPCSFCSKICFTEKNLRDHKKFFHSAKGRREYVCQYPECGKSFFDRYRFKVHSEKHGDIHIERIFKCSICKKILASRECLRTHMGIHGEKKFVCHSCGKQFATVTKLKLHCRTHEEGDFECRICGRKIETELRLKSHMSLKHGARKSHVCEVCGYQTNMKSKLKKHMECVHDKILKYHCSVCGKGFSEGANCRKHEETHKSESERRIIKCEICGDRTFKDRSSFRTHQIHFHTAYTEEMSHCSKCGNKFSNGLDLYKHSKRNLAKSKHNRCECRYCRQVFQNRCTLLIHFSDAHPQEKLLYKCQVCSIVFSSSAHLKLHLKAGCAKLLPIKKKVSKPPGEPQVFDCDFCDKHFAHAATLWKHEKIHLERPHICEICGKSFALEVNFKLHQKTHNGEKEFVCSFCSKAFLQKGNLTKHERTHTGEKPFECSHCGKKFAQPDALKTHVRIHTGEKPYSCPICSKSFSDFSTFHKHKKIHGK